MASTIAEQLRDALSQPSSIALDATQRRKAIQQKRIRLYRIADAAMLLAAITVAVVASPGQATTSDFLWGAGYALMTLAILETRGFYVLRLHQSPLDVAARIFAATSIAAMVLTFAHTLIDNEPQLADQTLRLWAFALTFLSAGRLGISFDRQRALARGETGSNTLIVGSGSVGHLIASRLASRPELGLRPIGFLDKDPMIDNSDTRDGLPVLGASWDLPEVVQMYNIEQVIVTFSTAPHAVMLNLIRRCRELGVEVVVVPRLFEEVNSRVEVEHLGGVPLLRAAAIDPKGWQFAVKYAFDRCAAAVGIVLIAPLLGALALAVRLSSPGPVLYKQRRVGLDGKEFDMLKFRSMRLAEEGEESSFEPAPGVAPGGVEGVDRRTAVGEFLRKTSLDELPQLFNVLRGDMSLVGPRPERTSYVRNFESHVYRYGDRHRVKSGLTGWAQVQGLRGQTSLTDRVEWDNYYIENWSLWLDLKIVLMTVPAVFGSRYAS